MKHRLKIVGWWVLATLIGLLWLILTVLFIPIWCIVWILVGKFYPSKTFNWIGDNLPNYITS